MIYGFKGEMIYLEAETTAENVALLYMRDTADETVKNLSAKFSPEEKETERKVAVSLLEPKLRKKYIIRSKCPECGKKCKNKRGLGIHRHNAHGVLSPLYDKNVRYREEKQAKRAVFEKEEKPETVIAFRKVEPSTEAILKNIE